MYKLTATRKKITVIAPLAGVPQRFTELGIYTPDFTVYAPSLNVGTNFYIGNSLVDNTWIPRPKATPINFVHGTGNIMGHDEVVSFDLSNLYLVVEAAGDSIIVEYVARERN